MNPANIQLLFFQHLKAKMPAHLSMVDEVAELLGISIDSAYRRIRGEKPLDLIEAYQLSNKYGISLDSLFKLESDAFIFNGNLKPADSELAYEDYLRQLLSNLQYIHSFQHKHLFCLMKDIPHFVHFLIPELAAFKCFFWMKSILQVESLKGVKFSLQDPLYEKYSDYSRKIVDLYIKIPNTEIWNVESLNSTLNQINFYVEAGAFQHKAESKILYNKVSELINHLEKQAEIGIKFRIGEQPNGKAGNYQMFVNELILGDNTYIAELDDVRVTFLNHSVLYFIATQDERFNEAMHSNFKNLMKKSTMISAIGEKERENFFNRLRDKISRRQALLG